MVGRSTSVWSDGMRVPLKAVRYFTPATIVVMSVFLFFTALRTAVNHKGCWVDGLHLEIDMDDVTCRYDLMNSK